MSKRLGLSQTPNLLQGYYESALLGKLAERIVGVDGAAVKKNPRLSSGLLARMHALGIKTLQEYILLLKKSEHERRNFISLVTINTTSWFREIAHFDWCGEWLSTHRVGAKVVVLCAPCSTGEEPYSLALVCEALRQNGTLSDYEVHGIDIDIEALKRARRALYPLDTVASIPRRFKSLLRKVQGHPEYFTLCPDVLRRVHFGRRNISNLSSSSSPIYDLVLCRNFLIYLSAQRQEQVFSSLANLIVPEGALIVGHSEVMPSFADNPLVSNVRASVYRRSLKDGSEEFNRSTLVVTDPSKVTSKLLTTGLRKAKFCCELVSSRKEAASRLENKSFELIVIDLGLWEGGGLDFLRTMRGQGVKTPVVLLGSRVESAAPDVLRALEDLAQDYVDKQEIVDGALVAVIERITELAQSSVGIARTVETELSLGSYAPEVVAIGASTGGPSALRRLLEDIGEGEHCPAIIVVQHMPTSWLQEFRARLASHAKLRVGSTESGTVLESGALYCADGDYHIVINQDSEGRLVLNRENSQPFKSHRPSVNMLFSSLAQLSKFRRFVGILLTGMGEDGALGLLEMKEQGYYTICESEESCVVFGMPRAAIQLRAAKSVASIGAMRSGLIHSLRRMS